MNVEIKACPFCGVGESEGGYGFIKHKETCYLYQRYIDSASNDRLIAGWQTRPLESALQKQIDILIASMESIGSWWTCPKCHHHSLMGYICFNCHYDPSIKGGENE